MCMGYMQMLHHLIHGTWASVDFGILGGPGTNPPRIPRSNCTYLQGPCSKKKKKKNFLRIQCKIQKKVQQNSESTLSCIHSTKIYCFPAVFGKSPGAGDSFIHLASTNCAPNVCQVLELIKTASADKKFTVLWYSRVDGFFVCFIF